MTTERFTYQVASHPFDGSVALASVGGGRPAVGITVYDSHRAELVANVVFYLTPETLVSLAEAPLEERCEVPSARHRLNARQQFFADGWPERLAALNGMLRPLHQIVPLRADNASTTG